MTTYEQAVAKSYNKYIKVKQFQVRDWVLRKTFQNTKDPKVGKLVANCEGPYQIEKVVGNIAYMLITRNGVQILYSWNATHLKQCHF